MSTIQHLFNRTLLIRRKQQIGGSFRKNFSTVTASEDAHVQRATSGSSPAIYGVDAASFEAWVGINADIKKNDLVTDSLTGNIYLVVAVINQGKDVACNEHQEVILTNYPK